VLAKRLRIAYVTESSGESSRAEEPQLVLSTQISHKRKGRAYGPPFSMISYLSSPAVIPLSSTVSVSHSAVDTSPQAVRSMAVKLQLLRLKLLEYAPVGPENRTLDILSLVP
jgi:hypothetical protein